MKPTKVRNYQMYQAPLHRVSAQLGSTLSNELRKKYGRRSARVVEGDTVKVLRGEYKDVEGKVASVSTLQNSVAIEGIKKEKGKGDKVDVFIHTSNLRITNLNTEDAWRVNKLEGKDKRTKPQVSEPLKETKPEKKPEEKPIKNETKKQAKPAKAEAKPKKETRKKAEVEK